ncbi:MAG: precorrin-6A/cobalt-precorrin-6A reductase, partial [Thermoleophilia bacterium]
MILLLGGTSDARALAAELRAGGHEVLLSVVTEYGARLAGSDADAVRQGALGEDELARLVGDAAAVVDATHPFAAEISRLAAAACGRAGRPYLRYERAATELPGEVLVASDADEAARLAVAAAAAAG